MTNKNTDISFAELSRYAWFADLAYVHWHKFNGSGGQDVSNNHYFGDREKMIEAAMNNKDKIAPEPLAQKIFDEENFNYSIVSYQRDTDSGFAASFYKNEVAGNGNANNGKEKILAIRGSKQPIADFVSADFVDIGLRGFALHQAIDMVNYIMRLQGDENDSVVAQLKLKKVTASITDFPPDNYLYMDNGSNSVTHYYCLEIENNGQGLGYIQEGDNIVISGHSLGGHLAALAQRLFPEIFAKTYTYNAPGFDGSVSEHLTDRFVAQVAELLPEAEAAHGSFLDVEDRIYTLESESSGPGDDSSLVPSDIAGMPPSPTMYITTEKNNHNISPFSDDLNVQAVFEKLLPEDMSFEDKQIILTHLMESASNAEGHTDEKLLESLSALLQTPTQEPIVHGEASNNRFGAPDWDARNSLHSRLIELEDKLKETQNQNLQLEIFGSLSASAIVNKAKAHNEEGLAFRYALKNLNTYYVSGVDYAELFNKDGELDFSDNYLHDRANFLVQLLHENVKDTGATNIPAPNGTVYSSLPSYYYADLTTGRQSLNAAYYDLGQEKDQYQQFVFGSSNGDSSIYGGSKTDHLYGMDGNDTIRGGGGNDYMEGGKGRDTMYGGSGKDIFYIQGEDESWDIFYGGTGEDTIQGADNDDTVIRVNNFSLAENSIEKIDGGEFESGKSGVNIIAGTDTDDTETYGRDVINLKGVTVTHINRIEGKGGDDTITGTAGADTIHGGDGYDIYHVGNGDTIYDSDGEGAIYLNGRRLNGGIHYDGYDDNIYLDVGRDGENPDDDVTYILQGDGDLVVEYQGNSILIKEYSDNQLGINLGGYNKVPWDNYNGHALDIVDSSPEHDIIRTGAMQDLVLAYFGDDIVFLGDDWDRGLGEAGNDTIYGGSGKDFILGGAWSEQSEATASYAANDNDTLYGGKDSDLVHGGVGDDYIFAGDDDDDIDGESTDSQGDWLVGDSGDDVISGSVVWINPL